MRRVSTSTKGSKTGAAVVVVALVLALGANLLWSALRDDSDDLLTEATGSLLTGGTRPDLDRLIADFEPRLAEVRDPLNNRFLGRLYLEKGRITGNIGVYDMARTTLEAGLDIYPDDIEAKGLLASAAFALHDFPRALALVETARAAAEAEVGSLALLGDIQLAVGDTASAHQSYTDLAWQLPGDPGVLVRLAQLAVAEGDNAAALARAASAIAAAEERGLVGSDLGWYQSFHGQIAFDTGDYALSSRSFAAALANDPTSTHNMAGLARSRAAEGSVDEAIELLEVVAEGPADVDDLAYLGDLYVATGRQAEADAAYARIERQAAEGSLAVQVHSRTLGLHYSDRGINAADAIRLAESELENRRDWKGYDAYAWALYRAGRFEEARAAADMALSSPVQNADLLYHSALISLALGDADAATRELRDALAISPEFDPLQAAHARDLLDDLSS